MKIPRRSDRKIEAYQQELIKTHFAEVDNMYRKMRGGGMITVIIFRF